MKNFNLKLRILFFPWLLIAICFIAGYTFLHWILVIKTGLINVREDIVQLWLPLALPFVPVLIWINRRLRVLKLANDRMPTLYILVAAMAIGAPTAVLQKYLDISSGTLTKLNGITEIEKSAKSKYYTLNQSYIDKSASSWYGTADVSGKRNQYLNFHLFVVMPVYEKAADTTAGACSYFLGVNYRKQVNNNGSDSEKDAWYNEFADESGREFEATDFGRFTYLERLGNTSDHDEYDKAIHKSALIKHAEPVVFIASNEKFEERAGGKLGWIFKSFLIGAAAWLILLAIPKPVPSAVESLKRGGEKKNDDLKDFLTALTPAPGYSATPVIVIINMLVFLAMVFAGLGFISFHGKDLLQWGANFGPATLHGEWWRLLTSTFLHGGIIHVFVNMFSLVLVGIFLEPVLGTKRFTLFYLLTGTVASCTSIWWHEHTVSVGASGAIFGLYGIFLAFLLLKVYPAGFSKAFLASSLIFISYNLLMGLSGGIDNAAHVGGLASGLILGLLFARNVKNNRVDAGLSG